MKRSLVLFGAAAWAWCAANAFAQVPPLAPSQIAANEAYSYFDSASIVQPSPSDRPQPGAPMPSAIIAKGPAPAQAPAAMMPEVPMPGCFAAPGCGADGDCDSCGCGCGILNWFPCGCKLADLGEACKIWKPCCEDDPTVVGGWLAQSFTWNPYNPVDRFNGPVTWTDRSNEYQMNELYFFAGRPTKTNGCGFDWGYRLDMLYGTNYRWDTSAGFESHWGNGQFYGLAVPAIYAEGAYNDTTVRVGRFISPVGYYTVGTANNFFPVIPYTYQYGEPFTHTGVWLNQKMSDKLTVGGALTHGWDNTDNTGNPNMGYLANATYTIDEKRALAWVGVAGDEPNFSNVRLSRIQNPLGGFTGYSGRYFQTLVYTHKFSDDVMGVLQSDFGTQHDALAVGQTSKWYGLNSYLYWNMTCQFQWGLNAEWFRDQGGFRVGGVLPSFGSPNARGLPSTGPLARTGYDGSFYRITFGPRYYFNPNLYTRVAFLADWYDGKANNPGGLRPYDDGTKNYQQIGVFDLVGTF